MIFSVCLVAWLTHAVTAHVEKETPPTTNPVLSECAPIHDVPENATGSERDRLTVTNFLDKLAPLGGQSELGHWDRGPKIVFGRFQKTKEGPWQHLEDIKAIEASRENQNAAMVAPFEQSYSYSSALSFSGVALIDGQETVLSDLHPLIKIRLEPDMTSTVLPPTGETVIGTLHFDGIKNWEAPSKHCPSFWQLSEPQFELLKQCLINQDCLPPNADR
ncbi:hypothetical protein [Shimia sp. SK013]|uniref:hypothetical protein n=1 Tax=Shimia sp. SK013 TaxID=1389006 RepID=UPI0006B4208A|nr:hypothetical protein [Shimia sp. SK013]